MFLDANYLMKEEFLLGRRIVGITIAIIIGIILGLAGPRLLARAFRHGLEWTLRQQLASAEKVQVKLGPVHPGDLVRGIVKDITVLGENFVTQEGIRYQRLYLHSQELRIDPGQLLFARELVWRGVGQTRLSVQADEAGLTSWLRQEYPDWHPQVKLTTDVVRISGIYDLDLLQLPFSAAGRLRKKTATSLVFLPLDIEVGGFAVPRKWTKGKLQDLLTGLEIPLEVPFPLELNSFKVNNGYLEAKWREPQAEEVGP